MARLIRCFAEEHDGKWEALCVDLDLAVQGNNFPEVYDSLNKAATIYLEAVAAIPDAAERARLLARSAPLHVRLRSVWRALRMWFQHGSRSGRLLGAQYTMLCRA